MPAATAQPLLCLGIAALGVFCLEPAKSRGFSAPAGPPGSGAILCAAALAAASACAEVDTRRLIVDYFLEPARIGLETALSNVLDDEPAEAPLRRKPACQCQS